MIALRILRIELGEGRSRQWYYMGWDGSCDSYGSATAFLRWVRLSGASFMAKEISKTQLNWIGLCSWPAACEECEE